VGVWYLSPAIGPAKIPVNTGLSAGAGDRLMLDSLLFLIMGSIPVRYGDQEINSTLVDMNDVS
jgi:hypothetical protein